MPSRNKTNKCTDDPALKQQGVIKVARSFPNLIEPWSQDEIPDYLGSVDHSLAITSRVKYAEALAAEQAKLNMLVRQLKDSGKSLIVALQGRDGAGKGGATKRIAEAIGHDFKIFQSVPIGPPTQEETEHYFLHRFQKGERMPACGQVRVFDRCWAERVLVERVMELTPKKELRASYGQLRVFEWQLTQGGAVLVKIWLDITKAEQKRRLERRKRNKPWKVSPNDHVARKHWDEYTPAANELFYRTGSDFAPWYIIASEDKLYARVQVLKVINAALKKALKASS